MSPTRVLYVAHSVAAHGGGMERMGRALLTYGADVEFAVIASEGLEDLPADVHAVQVRLPARPAFARIALFAWRSGRVIRQLRDHVDVVHTCGAITTEPADVTTVHLCHAAAPSVPRSGPRWRRLNAAVARALGRRLERRQYRRGRVRHLVAVSAHVEAQLAEHYPDVPRSVIRNGVDVRAFLAPARTGEFAGDLCCVMVTGDFATKGVELAVRAVAATPCVTLRVVGAGPAAHYEAIAASLGAAARVTFAGFEADPRPSYDAADVVLCVSDYESFGLYLVEGALSGCAVVSTDVGVARELVGDGAGGVIIERTQAALEAALAACARDRAATREWGAGAARRAQAFSVATMVERYEDLYRTLADDTARTIHVLHVGLESPATRMGGLNRYLDRLAAAQRAAGDRADVAWIAEGSTPGASAIAPGRPWPRRQRAFARAIRRSTAELVDVHFAAHAFWAVRSGALRRRPLVVHFQGPWSLESQMAGDGPVSVWVKARVEGYVLRRADLVVTLSSAFRDVAIQRFGVAPHRTVVLAPGVAVPPPRDRAAARESLGIRQDEVVWLCVRRLVERMGLDVAIEAFATDAPAQHRLVIVGDGPLRDDLAHRATELGVEQRVRFTGGLSDDDLDAWYWAADVTLVPSRAHEGFGLVVLESLARGTPVVACDVDGLRDAARVSDAVTLCGPTAADLAAAVTATLAKPATREGARADAMGHQWGDVATQHRHWYRRVLRGELPRGVVVLDHTARASGGELAMARLLSALDDRWRPHVLLAEDGPLVAELARRGISSEVLALAPRTRDLARDVVGRRRVAASLLDTASYVVRLRWRLHRRAPAIVHSNSMKAHVYGALASIFAPWTFVMHVRDRWEPPYVSAGVARTLRAIARFGPALVIANSNSTARATRVPATVLASPVEPAFFAVPAPAPAPVLRLAVVGRLAPWKGQQLAIDAVATFAATRPVHLTVVGDALFGEDDYAADLAESVRARHLEPVVTLTGHVDDVTGVLAGCDATILSSLSPEPFGNVVVEAMAAGRPVIVPNRGGVTEYVIDDPAGGSGYFYEMGEVASLVAAITRVADDPADARRRGERARIAAEAFRADAVAGTLATLYDGLR